MRQLRDGRHPLAATATIENDSEDGLARVQVSMDGRPQTRWIAMRAKERKDIVFTGWEKPSPGTHTIQCGDLQKQLSVPEP